jgi:hypothetical protein
VLKILYFFSFGVKHVFTAKYVFKQIWAQKNRAAKLGLYFLVALTGFEPVTYRV